MQDLFKKTENPYLKTHRDDPVNWYSWSDEAFSQSKKRNLPIFLSVGYMSCHWCHVMHRESFLDKDIATILNEQFICIKVDREERPDIDALYMKALIGFSGQGGWPMSIFLTPEGVPFFAGTYFPKFPMPDQMAFAEVLGRVSIMWHRHHQDVLNVSKEVKEKLSVISLVKPDEPSSFHIKPLIDFKFGGLNGAPKFPQFRLWQSIFLSGILLEDQSLIDVSYLTATSLSFGGIYDHLDGGLFRYCTDDQWSTPHFEKILSDNAQLVGFFSDLHNYTQHDFLTMRAHDTVSWVLDCLYTENGFMTATDAESDGVEGGYYIWHTQSLKKILGTDYDAAKKYFNFNESNPTQILTTQHLQEETFEKDQIERIFQKLHTNKETRTPPSVDYKILLDWNALMITALAKASQTFNEPLWLKIAISQDQSLKNKFFKNDQWHHSLTKEELGNQCFIEDIANLINSKVQLYLVTSKEHYLHDAKQLVDYAERYFDTKAMLYRQNPISENQLFLNPWQWDDHAVPSGNGMMAYNMIVLALIDGSSFYKKRWEQLLKSYQCHVKDQRTCGLMISAINISQHGLLVKANWLDRPISLKCPPHWLMQQSDQGEVICCDFNGCIAGIATFEDLASL